MEQLTLPLRSRRLLRVVLLSGGIASGLVAIEVARRFGTDDLVLLNHDIHPLVEAADVKRFKDDIAAHLCVPITYANHDRWDAVTQFDVVREARAFKVGTGSELCTARLKTEPFRRWREAHTRPGEAVFYYGFDAGERKRITRRTTILGAEGYATDYPLALWVPRTIVDPREVGIEPPNTYSVFKHGNCCGCLKAGKQHWYVVFCTRPDIWQLGKDAEEDIGYTIHDGASLEELEPLFVAMRDAGIPATEHIQSQTFWADVRRRVRLPVVGPAPALDLQAEANAKPCECVFRKRRHREIPPPCDCGIGDHVRGGHRLFCNRVLGRSPEAA